MQLDQSLIRNGLYHSENLVRDIARYWFNDKTPELTPRPSEIIRAYDAYGLANVSLLRPHTCDETLLNWILEQAPRDFGLSTIDDYQASHVWDMIVKSDLALIGKRLPDIKRAIDTWHGRHHSPQTQLKVLSQLEARLNAARQGPAECFRQILPLCNKIDSLHGDDQFVLRATTIQELDALIEIAAESDCGAQVLQQLAHGDPEKSGYELVAMMQLATHMKLQEAAPIAIQLMEIDWSSLHEAISGFFISNTNAQMQALVSQRFDDLLWHQQLYLAEVFAADYSPTAATYLRHHLEVAIDRDEYDKIVSLAQSLAFQFCVEDVERLDEIYQFDYADPELVQVAETLYVFDNLGGLKHHRSSTWKRAEEIMRELHAEEKRRRQSQTTSRTGRNEPCPCGSGKKYKKCCWLAI